MLSAGCADDPPSPNPNRIDAPAAIIVSPDTLMGELARLTDWRSRTGLPTRLVPLSEALSTGQGPDDAARLRDYLKSQWEQHGLGFVTLAGDVAVMPMRQAHVVVDIETEQTYEEADAPIELYFADLDGPWEPDEAGAYGEIGFTGDLLPDVALGRLPVETPDEARAYVDKLLAYEHGPDSRFERGWEAHLLLAAGYAGFDVYGSAGLEGYVVPELPEHLELTRLYSDYGERPGAVDLTVASMDEAFAAGQSITFMMGHGFEGSMGAYDNLAEVMAIDNAACPSIFVTCECLGGRFDWPDGDSSGEEFVKGATGGVAYLGSTNLGVGYPSLTLVQQRLARALYGSADPPARIGAALQTALREYSKVEWLQTYAHPDRWSNLVSVLLGDPAVKVWTGRARDIEVDLVDGDDCSWVTLAVRADGAPAAGVVATAYRPGELLLVGSTNDAGEVSLATDECALSGTMLTVSGRDIVPFAQTL